MSKTFNILHTYIHVHTYMNQYTHKYVKVSSCMKNARFMAFFIDLTEFHRNYIITEPIQKINFE